MYEISRIYGPDCTGEEEDLPGINYIIGLDLGQSQDYSAIAIIEKMPGNVYHVVKLERVRGVPYPQIVTRTKAIVQQLGRGSTLVVDGTGVGAPIVDLLNQAGLKPVTIHIHGGDKVTQDESEQAAGRAKGWVMGASRRWGCPKKDLVATLQVLLQNKRLKIAAGPLSDILATEMLDFRVKINAETAHESYAAWREAEHDDLVLAVALACWWGQYRPFPPIMPTTVLMHGRV